VITDASQQLQKRNDVLLILLGHSMGGSPSIAGSVITAKNLVVPGGGGAPVIQIKKCIEWVGGTGR
jgi:hypothetical protein